MIPEDKKALVEKALMETFEIAEMQQVEAINTGLSSALIFKILIKDKPYLLRIINSDHATKNPANWFNSMQMAADAGIAPKIWYANMVDRILITDFIESKVLPIAIAKQKLPELLKHLHQLPDFKNRVDYFKAIADFMQVLHQKNVLPKEITLDIIQQYELIREVYFGNGYTDLVPSHNDLKPENMIFDGDKVWLIDWEAAFMNDRYFDIAVIANFVVFCEEDEKELLKRYFGYEVEGREMARFYLMRQLLHLAYFSMFIYLGHEPGKKIETDVIIPDFRAFHDQIWEGIISLKANQNRQLYAWVHLAKFKKNKSKGRFEGSLRSVSN